MEALPLLLRNLFLCRQQKAKQDRERESALPVAKHREFVKILKGSVYMQASTEAAPQPPTEKKTGLCIEDVVYCAACMHRTDH